MVKGMTRGDLNVRTSPVVPNTGSNISFVSRGKVSFIGDLFTSAIDNKLWIQLSELNGVPIGGAFIASWVTDFADYNPPVSPILTHTIEVYSDGSLKIDGIPY